ncbi:hypothetical protein C6V83_01940 [Gordonia iterans]|uniref:Uncharacterized protein n=1 Tax=Gordonia iterans TaxID=1004901 RepID=A0A2S0KC64_9ACTN|nr:DUF5715 family protein [Gordonia iterans]AVL99243.1 hypothetical protein C6V83_01940 [Gordonia iterans]
MRTEGGDLTQFRHAVDAIAETLDPWAPAPEVARALPGLIADQPAVEAVLSAHPNGYAAAVRGLCDEAAAFTPNSRSSARDLASLVRVLLLHLVDVMWWGDQPEHTDSSAVLDADDLVDLDGLRDRGRLRFRYRHQATTARARVVRGVQRRLPFPSGPPGAGLRYPRARPEIIALLNLIADEYSTERGGAGIGGLREGIWVNSAARSVAHQEHLRELGYSAMRPSSHCSGYAVDIAVEWLRPSGGDEVLKQILIEWQQRGEINVIDEGPAWHVCPAPDSMARLRALYDLQMKDEPCAESH